MKNRNPRRCKTPPVNSKKKNNITKTEKILAAEKESVVKDRIEGDLTGRRRDGRTERREGEKKKRERRRRVSASSSDSSSSSSSSSSSLRGEGEERERESERVRE